MATIERQLQQNLNKIENWATSNGFKFSKSKKKKKKKKKKPWRVPTTLSRSLGHTSHRGRY